MASSKWFEVDKAGLAQLLERRGQSFVITELVQNAWDEDVMNVEIHFSKRITDKRWVVSITDDSPEGFTNLRDSFVLFAPSKKKGDAEKRGRFNLGEKLVLALASEATITSTTGTVFFRRDGARSQSTRQKRPSGTCFQGVFPTFKNSDVDEALAVLRRLVPPFGVRTYVTISGFEPLGRAPFEIEHREPVHTFKAQLPTEVAGSDGVLKRTTRYTDVNLYEATNDFRPGIYELGIPVVDTDDKYIVDIGQKVPLNIERDNVTPAYLRSVRTFVLNETAKLLTAEDAASTWVTDALSDDRIEGDAVHDIIEKRYGDKAVAYDPSDPEANRIAASEGYTVIHSGAFNKAQWSNIRRAQALTPAGQTTPSAHVLTSEDGVPPLDRDEWTVEHLDIAVYAHRVHQALIGSSLIVDFQHTKTVNRHAAWYGHGHLTINISVLGKKWLRSVTRTELDALLIHEFGHYYEADHLSAKYYDALCRLGARLRDHDKEIGDLR